MHIYGAYAPQQLLQLNNPKEGFIIKGWSENVENTMKNYRVQLSPLRFGAGLKGKLLDAMRFGLPSVTTEVGAEGMCGKFAFGGSVVASNEDFINASVKLYSDENTLERSPEKWFQLYKGTFSKGSVFRSF